MAGGKSQDDDWLLSGNAVELPDPADMAGRSSRRKAGNTARRRSVPGKVTAGENPDAGSGRDENAGSHAGTVGNVGGSQSERTSSDGVVRGNAGHGGDSAGHAAVEGDVQAHDASYAEPVDGGGAPEHPVTNVTLDDWPTAVAQDGSDAEQDKHGGAADDMASSAAEDARDDDDWDITPPAATDGASSDAPLGNGPASASVAGDDDWAVPTSAPADGGASATGEDNASVALWDGLPASDGDTLDDDWDLRTDEDSGKPGDGGSEAAGGTTTADGMVADDRMVSAVGSSDHSPEAGPRRTAETSPNRAGGTPEERVDEPQDGRSGRPPRQDEAPAPAATHDASRKTQEPTTDSQPDGVWGADDADGMWEDAAGGSLWGDDDDWSTDAQAGTSSPAGKRNDAMASNGGNAETDGRADAPTARQAPAPSDRTPDGQPSGDGNDSAHDVWDDWDDDAASVSSDDGWDDSPSGSASPQADRTMPAEAPHGKPARSDNPTVSDEESRKAGNSSKSTNPWGQMGQWDETDDDFLGLSDASPDEAPEDDWSVKPNQVKGVTSRDDIPLSADEPSDDEPEDESYGQTPKRGGGFPKRHTSGKTVKHRPEPEDDDRYDDEEDDYDDPEDDDTDDEEDASPIDRALDIIQTLPLKLIAIIAAILLGVGTIAGGAVWYVNWHNEQTAIQQKQEEDRRKAEEMDRMRSDWNSKLNTAKTLIGKVEDDETAMKDDDIKTTVDSLNKAVRKDEPTTVEDFSAENITLDTLTAKLSKLYDAVQEQGVDDVKKSMDDMVKQAGTLNDAPDGDDKTNMQKLADELSKTTVDKDNMDDVSKKITQLKDLIDKVSKAKADKQAADDAAKKAAEDAAKKAAEDEAAAKKAAEEEAARKAAAQRATPTPKRTYTPTRRATPTAPKTTQAPAPAPTTQAPSGNVGGNVG